MSAVPQESDLVKDVVAAIRHVLGIACGASALPELILNLLKLPTFCQVQAEHGNHPSHGTCCGRRNTTHISAAYACEVQSSHRHESINDATHT